MSQCSARQDFDCEEIFMCICNSGPQWLPTHFPQSGLSPKPMNIVSDWFSFVTRPISKRFDFVIGFVTRLIEKRFDFPVVF